MSEEDLMAVLEKVINELLIFLGENKIKINPDFCPLKDIAGFTSHSGVVATSMLEEEINTKIGDINLFVSEDGKRALNISEISKRIIKVQKEGVND